MMPPYIHPKHYLENSTHIIFGPQALWPLDDRLLWDANPDSIPDDDIIAVNMITFKGLQITGRKVRRRNLSLCTLSTSTSVLKLYYRCNTNIFYNLFDWICSQMGRLYWFRETLFHSFNWFTCSWFNKASLLVDIYKQVAIDNKT